MRTGRLVSLDQYWTANIMKLSVLSRAVWAVAIVIVIWSSSLVAQAPGYGYARAITIDHRQVSNSDQTDFPVLISGTFPYLATVANGGHVQNANGYDMIFTSDAAGQNKMDHEIDSYDPTTGTVAFWVRIPTLSHTADTSIYIWYGNSSISTSQENKSGVWSNHYVGVYHFGNGSSLSLSDSSAQGNTLSNSTATAGAGKIGGSVTTGGTKYLYNSAPSGMPTGTAARTLQVWFKQSSANSAEWIAGWGSTPYFLLGATTLSTYGLYSGGWQGINSTGTSDTSNWHYFASTLSSPGAWANIAQYVDGTAQITSTSLSGSLTTSGDALYVGRQNTYNGNYFSGQIDELRISSVARSSDWIATEYKNQSSPATFAYVSPVEVSGAQPSPYSLLVAPSSFLHSRAVTINHTQVANSDQTDFPVLVSGTFSYLATTTHGGSVQNANGYDIVFTSDEAGQNQLDHEIDSYDPATGKAAFWVRIPALSHTSDGVLYMWYGNTNVVASQENKPGVWTNHYVGVFHFGTSTSLSLADSSGSGNTLSGGINAVAGTGEVGGAVTTGGGNFLYDLAPAAMPAGTAARTLQVWFKQSSANTGAWIAGWGGAPYFLIGGTTLSTYGAWSGSAWQGVNSTGTSDTSNWHSFVSTLSSQGAWSNVAQYFDGSSVSTSTSLSGSLQTTGNSLYIGRQNSYDGNYFNGLVDEVRISSVARSSDWIATEYNNVHAPSTFITVAPNESGPFISSVTPAAAYPGTQITISGAGFGSTQGAGTVVLGTANATVVSWSNTSIVATVVAGSQSGVAQVVQGGVSSNTYQFTVIVPTITTVAPVTATTGSQVTISGSGFGASQGSGSVVLGTANGSVTSWTDTQVVATVASGSSSGVAQVLQAGIASNSVNFTIVPGLSITGISPFAGPIGTQVVISGTGFGASQGDSTVQLGTAAVSVLSWSDTAIQVVVPSGATSAEFTVTTSGVALYSSQFTVTALPANWLQTDIGAVPQQGSGTYSSGVFTTAGSGTAQATAADSLHFIYQSLTGDGTIVARAISTNVSYPFSGVMMRESLDPGSKAISVADVGGIYTVYRSTTNANTTTISTNPSVTWPEWVKLTRAGSTFSAYVSSDGVNWVAAGQSQTINMAQTVYVGLATSGGNGLNTTPFDNVSLVSSASATPQINTVSATTGSVGAQVVISGANFGDTQGIGVVLLNDVSVTVNSWNATSITITIPTGATSGYLVVASAPGMNTSNPVFFTVTAQPLPNGWLDQDVGAVPAQGSATFNSGTFTVQGTGNLEGQSDAFHMAYLPLTGDGSIVAHVTSSTTYNSRTGVMMRETLDDDSPSMWVGWADGFYYTTYRTAVGANTATVGTPGITGWPWVKISRMGNTLTGYMSQDGINWTLTYGPVEIDMAQTIYAGLVTSQSATAVTGVFDHVSIGSSTVPAPEITSVSATNVSVGNQVDVAGLNFGSTQGNSLLLLNGLAVTVNSWSDTSISMTVPSGATSGLLSVLLSPSMNSSNSIAMTVSSQPLPSGWLDQDIGEPSTPGVASYGSDIFTIQGSGALGGTVDAFHFVYQPLSTDGTIVARIASMSQYGEAGVMMRQSLDADSTEVSATNSGIAYRSTTAGSTQNNSGGGAPYWVKLTRAANVFTAYGSSDGMNWTQTGSQTVTTGQTVYVGIALLAGANTTATFDSVSISPGGTLPNPTIGAVTPTTGAPGGTVAITGSGFGATQGTNSVQFNGAAATITGWSDTEIDVVVPDAATTGPISVTVGGITANGPTFTIAFAAQLTDSLGHVSNYSSSLYGGEWVITSSDGAGCSSCTTRGTNSNQYDGNGNLLWSTDALGHTVSYQYDSSNNLIAQYVRLDANTVAKTSYTYNSLGQVLTVKDALGNTTTNTYDTHGNLLTITTPKPDSNTAASVTTFGYDTKGELTTITDPLNHVTTIAYNPVGLIQSITDANNKVTSYEYDSRGNRTAVVDALQNRTTFDYDAGNRLTKITYSDTTTTQFGYDSRGRRTSVTDQNNKVTQYAYDDADRLTSVTDAALHVTQYGYDTENNLTSITDANNHTTTFGYDDYGRVNLTTFPSTYTESYAYDAIGNLTSKTDRKNQTITYVYDALNRLSRKIYPDSSEVDYVYDLVGKIQRVNDPTGTYAFAYDNMGRLIGTTTTYSFLPTKTFSNSYGYDAASNRTGYTDPEGGTVAYGYDVLNRLTSLNSSLAGQFTFGYDDLSRRTSLNRPNGVNTSYSYDSLSRLLSVLHQVGGVTIDGAAYTVDNAGNRQTKQNLLNSVTDTYSYDDIYQLTRVLQSVNGVTESYSYDDVGNRLSSLNLSPYQYDASNQLTSTPTTTFTYDRNGNTTTKTDSNGTTQYAWDFENRLTSVTLPNDSGTVTFTYDPFGRRIQKESTTGTTIYAYDGAKAIEDVNGAGAMTARYVQGAGIDEPIAESAAGLYFYSADGLGSITSLTDTTGTAVASYTYDARGNIVASSGANANRFRYTGREYDSETGLYYYRARYYDPSSSRFISVDPFGLLGGINSYAYTFNNPIRFRDPYGLAASETNCACSAKHGFGFGGYIGGDAFAGGGDNGLASSAGIGVGYFNNFRNDTIGAHNESIGYFATGGGVAFAPSANDPLQQLTAGYNPDPNDSNFALGGYAGLGGGGFFTNAGDACQLLGPFETFTAASPFLTLSISHDQNGTWIITGTIGPGMIGGIDAYETNTVRAKGINLP